MTGEPRPGSAPGGRVRLDATVRGRVQGVGYRVFALREAMALGLDGSVANLGDGSVRVVAEGPRRDLEALLALLARGPARRLGRRRADPLGAGARHRARVPDRRPGRTGATDPRRSRRGDARQAAARGPGAAWHRP